MSRFGNLEFSENPGERTAETPALKDETFYLNAGLAAFGKGRFEQALRAYAKVLEFNSRSVAAWIGQARMLIELGEFKEAKIWADKGLEVFPTEPELLAAKGVALARLGDLKAALSYSDAAIEERGNTAYVWLARGDVLLARKEKRADYCFEKAFNLAPADWFFLWLGSRIQSFYKHFARALKFAQQALAFNPAEAALWLQIGRCELALGLAGQAQMSLEQARELDPECDEADKILMEATNTTFFDRLTRQLGRLFQK